jgi:hypothetical protein
MTLCHRLLTFAMLLLTISVAAAAEPASRRPQADTPETRLRKYLDALDHHRGDDARAIAKQAAEQSPGPIADLMIRHSRLLAANKAEPRSRPTAKREDNAQSDILVTRTYNVADLVVAPQEVDIGQLPAGDAQQNEAGEPDFDPLVDLIITTVKPATWNTVGGRGAVTPFKANFAIVVSQTAQVHAEIVELLECLRRLQDVTVMFDTKFITLPEKDLPQALQAGNAKKEVTLDSRQTAELVAAAGKSGTSQSFRRVTTLCGQSVLLPASITLSDAARLRLKANVSADRRGVILVLKGGQTQVGSARVADGRTLAVDFTPPTDEHKSNSATGVTRRFLLLSPQIIIAEEEEEKLGIEASK